jgi:hypothetical protein
VPQATFRLQLRARSSLVSYLPDFTNFSTFSALLTLDLFEFPVTWLSSSLDPPSDFSGLPHQQIDNSPYIVCCLSIGTYSIAQAGCEVNGFYDYLSALRDLLSYTHKGASPVPKVKSR